MDFNSLVLVNFFYCLFIKITPILLTQVTLKTEDYVYKQTKYGRIKGFVSERVNGDKVEQFLGVPFAAPPVGDLRLERPVDPTPWKDTLDTLSIPPACLQKNGMKDSMEYINSHVPNFDLEDEDCLYLNLYKPMKESKTGYPVLLFVHGGSNEVGMGAMFDGDVLAGFAEIIVITFNYRLGALGFYGAQEEGLEGNYGFLDQIMAMKWIKENIAYFNGDPTKVTIDGHSAGAADVGFHVVSPLAKGLFRYAVMQSGSPLAFWAMSPSEWRPGYNINEREITHPKTNHLKKLLKSLDMDAVRNKKGRYTAASFITFPAVVDKHFLMKRPLETYMQGELNGESFLMSFTKDEGSDHAKTLMEHYNVNRTFDEHLFHRVLKDFGPGLFPTICGISVRDMIGGMDLITTALEPVMTELIGDFVLPTVADNIVLPTLMKQLFQPIFKDICHIREIILHEYGHWEHDEKDEFKTVKRYIEMESDFVFIAPMIKLANILSRSTDNIYVFSFDHVSDKAPGPEWLGVPHGRDLFYQFGAPLVGHELFQYSDIDKEASKLMMTLWGNYVKYGKLTSDGSQHHPPYTNDTKVFHRLLLKDNSITLKAYKNYKPRKMAFWNSFLPQLKCPEKKAHCKTSSSTITIPQLSILIVCVLGALIR